MAEEAPQKRDARGGSSRLIPVVGAVVVLAIYLFHAACFIHYVNDDAFITFRYSRFWATGLGPYFNPGEHVEGYTNFLLMLLLVPVYALGGENAVPPAGKAIGVVSGALSLLLVIALCRRLCRRDEAGLLGGGVFGIVAAGLVAVNPAFALNSVSGLETTLFGLCLTAGACLGVVGIERGRWRGAGLAFAAAALTRPEGVLLFGAYWLVQAFVVGPRLPGFLRTLVRKGWTTAAAETKFSKHLLPDGAIVVGVVAAHLVFRLIAYDGQWLPNTFYAKVGGFWRISAWSYVNYGTIKPFLGLGGVAVACVGWSLSGSVRRSLAVLAIPLCGCLFPFITGTDWMPGYRLVVPYLVLVAAFMAIGWGEVSRRLFAKVPWLGTLALYATIPLLWVLLAGLRGALYEEITTRAKGYKTGHYALAAWLREGEAKPGDTIALMDTGIVGYYCPQQRILDITGLTNAFIARCPGDLINKRYDPAYVLDQKPAFVVLVLTNSEAASKAPSAGPAWTTFTETEANILKHPEFARWYRRTPRQRDGDSHWIEQMAQSIGAERVFEHQVSPRYYLLAVFRRAMEPAS